VPARHENQVAQRTKELIVNRQVFKLFYAKPSQARNCAGKNLPALAWERGKSENSMDTAHRKKKKNFPRRTTAGTGYSAARRVGKPEKVGLLKGKSLGGLPAFPTGKPQRKIRPGGERAGREKERYV